VQKYAGFSEQPNFSPTFLRLFSRQGSPEPNKHTITQQLTTIKKILRKKRGKHKKHDRKPQKRKNSGEKGKNGDGGRGLRGGEKGLALPELRLAQFK